MSQTGMRSVKHASSVAGMSQSAHLSDSNRSAAGIGFIIMAMVAISLNDMLMKRLSGDYPLHQMVFIRSSVGILFSLVLVQLEGGWTILKTKTPGLQALRGILIVVSNMTFFSALAVMPLAEATALFFVAPLFITLLSIPLLGEKVGAMRIGAIIAGFAGVAIMLEPWQGQGTRAASDYVLLLPVLAALTYALNQILTRKLGATSKASAMAVYIQLMFILVSSIFYAVAGDGRYVDLSENESVRFLLRAWVWPKEGDIYLFVVLGLVSGVIGYCLSQAYRLTDAATLAPFEYVGLPLAVIWGWLIWGELPGLSASIGIALIMGAGLFVFVRERIRKRALVSAKRVHRRY